MSTYEFEYRIGDLVCTQADLKNPYEVMSISIRRSGVAYDLWRFYNERGERIERYGKTLTRFSDIDHVSPHYFQD